MQLRRRLRQVGETSHEPPCTRVRATTTTATRAPWKRTARPQDTGLRTNSETGFWGMGSRVSFCARAHVYGEVTLSLGGMVRAGHNVINLVIAGRGGY